ncbi:hypothetical protein COOONC_17187 [Cooperia oncophora]
MAIHKDIRTRTLQLAIPLVQGLQRRVTSLERAVAVLKAAPMGKIRIGVAKPIPIDQCRSSAHSPIFTRSERLLARGSSPRGRRRQVRN